MSSRSTLIIALVWSSPFAMSASTRSLNNVIASAKAVFSTIIAEAQLASLPTALNSKRFPVKAKGLVLFLSVLSISSSGISGMSNFIPFLSATLNSVSLSESTICFKRPESCCPKNAEIIAGGASCPPKRCALVALMIDAFRSASWRYTAIKVSTMNTTKRKLSSGVFPGACKRTPVSVQRLQLLCFPLPLIPSKGFSCSNALKPCLRATFFINDIKSML